MATVRPFSDGAATSEDAMNATKRMALLSIATSIATLALKFGAYFLTDSVGLLSDALEALVNLAAGLVALTALTIAEQPADDRHSLWPRQGRVFFQSASRVR